MNDQRRSLLGLHAGVILLGGTALFSKLLPLDAIDITIWRSVFAALFLVGLLALTRSRLRLDCRRDYAMVLLLGLLFAVHWVTYFHAMQVSTVAVGVVAMFTFPVITIFLEPIFHRGRIDAVDVAGGLIVLAGVYLMVPEFSFDSAAALGVFWGLVSALIYALRNVLQRHYFTHYPARVAIFYQILIVCVVVAPFGSAAPFTAESTVSLWLMLLLLGTVFTALPHTLFANGLIHFRAKTVGLINCLQVFYAIGFALILLNEMPDMRTLIGGVLIVGTSVFESVRSAR